MAFVLGDQIVRLTAIYQTTGNNIFNLLCYFMHANILFCEYYIIHL
jgi:hypothetical protein